MVADRFDLVGGVGQAAGGAASKTIENHSISGQNFLEIGGSSHKAHLDELERTSLIIQPL